MTSEAHITNMPVDKPKRWQKHMAWFGLAIALVNMPIYEYLVWTSPDQREIPWFNTPFSCLGLALAAFGTWSIFKHGRGVLKKGLAAIGLMVTFALVGLFNWYIFSYSYSLPDSVHAIAVDEIAPEFTLLNQEGQLVSLSDYKGKKVVLVFYRGDW